MYLLLCAGWLSGCSGLLPTSRNEAPMFKTFDEARRSIESLVPMQSGLHRLTQLGIDPIKQPHITILTQADVARRLANNSNMLREDLDPGILQCMRARDACRGWELTLSSISKERTGNFFSDFFNFSRRTHTTGWRFIALIVLVDNLVVYRTWGGEPMVNEIEVRTNPLGPLQDTGPSLVPPPTLR
jgi:hypothetical protein